MRQFMGFLFVLVKKIVLVLRNGSFLPVISLAPNLSPWINVLVFMVISFQCLLGLQFFIRSLCGFLLSCMSGMGVCLTTCHVGMFILSCLTCPMVSLSLPVLGTPFWATPFRGGPWCGVSHTSSKSINAKMTSCGLLFTAQFGFVKT